MIFLGSSGLERMRLGVGCWYKAAVCMFTEADLNVSGKRSIGAIASASTYDWVEPCLRWAIRDDTLQSVRGEKAWGTGITQGKLGL